MQATMQVQPDVARTEGLGTGTGQDPAFRLDRRTAPGHESTPFGRAPRAIHADGAEIA